MHFIKILLLLMLTGLAQAAEAPAKLVIAHRGASGYLPEHTLAAKVLAVAQGADYVEQDVVMTADDQLVVFHDLTLERMTDVAEIFPARARNDGSFYVIDFTLAELRQLAVSEGRTMDNGVAQPVFPGRFPLGKSHFGIHTMQEELELLQGLQQSTGRQVGIYTELKSPWFHHQHGKDLSVAVLRLLQDFGYDSAEDLVYVQSFDYNELLRIHDEVMPALGSTLKLVQLIAENSWGETFAPGPAGTLVAYDYSWMHTSVGLRNLAKVVAGIGPAYSMLVAAQSTPGAIQINSMTSDAHAAGLLVHPYTFRRDEGQLPSYVGSFDELLELFLFTVDVDGIFTDFPDLAVRFLQSHH